MINPSDLPDNCEWELRWRQGEQLYYTQCDCWFDYDSIPDFCPSCNKEIYK